MAVLARTLTMGVCVVAALAASCSAEDNSDLAFASEQFEQFKANEASFLADFEANHDFAYVNSMSIITGYTAKQEQVILERFGPYFGQEPSVSPQLTPWSSPYAAKGSLHVRVCPAVRVWQVLYTAINADDQPVAVVQFGDVNQWVIWEECTFSQSPHATGVRCMPTVRTVRMVVIRLPFSSFDDITVQNIRIKACTGHVSSGLRPDDPSEEDSSEEDQSGPDQSGPDQSEPDPSGTDKRGPHIP